VTNGLAAFAIYLAMSLGFSTAQAQGIWGKTVGVTLQVMNRSGTDAIVRMTVTRPDGRIEFSKEGLIANGQARSWVEKLSPGSKLNWSYSIAALSASLDLATRTIADNNGQEIVEILPALQKYDDNSAQTKLRQIASQLDLDKNPIQLKKAQEMMGTFWVAEDGGAQIGPGWKVAEIEVTSDGTIRFEDSVTIEGNSAISVSSNVPLLAQLQAGFESGQIYKMRWAAEHFTFRNSTMESQLPMLKLPELKQISASLRSSPSSKLCYVRQARVLKYVAHSVIRGTRVSFNASLAKSTVFTASGSYIFDASEASLAALTDQVVKIESVCLQRAQTLSFVDHQISTLERPIDPAPQPKP